MTLNQIVYQIKSIALSHKMIKSFFEGQVTDRLNDKGTKYPCCFLTLRNGSYDSSRGASIFNFSLVVVDLVNISKDTKKNQLDVESDSLQTLQDLFTQFSRPEYEGWRISESNSFNIIYEGDNDLHGGASLDLSISTRYSRDACGLHSNNVYQSIFNFANNGQLMKTGLTFDLTYVANGNEGSSITLPLLIGKGILLVVRENSVLFENSGVLSSNEFSFFNGTITFGVPLNINEKILILYNEA
jgi:hypothetical protein